MALGGKELPNQYEFGELREDKAEGSGTSVKVNPSHPRTKAANHNE